MVTCGRARTALSTYRQPTSCLCGRGGGFNARGAPSCAFRTSSSNETSTYAMKSCEKPGGSQSHTSIKNFLFISIAPESPQRLPFEFIHISISSKKSRKQGSSNERSNNCEENKNKYNNLPDSYVHRCVRATICYLFKSSA